ncbi:MAG: hypothetical protein GX027_08450 [Clostridiaceae bacterium]|jgi:hypothetical protein|nr:hypothetical protein [Clostridiaceae bacterium]
MVFITGINCGRELADHTEGWSTHANVLESISEKQKEYKILPLIGGDVSE